VALLLARAVRVLAAVLTLLAIFWTLYGSADLLGVADPGDEFGDVAIFAAGVVAMVIGGAFGTAAHRFIETR
jgi:hypothetical protein